MKRTAGTLDQPTKVYCLPSPHLPELPLSATDSFLSRFEAVLPSTQRKYRFQSIPRVIVSDKVPVPFHQCSSSLPQEANPYVPLLSGYSDAVLVASESEQRKEMRKAYVHHAVNHIVRTQALIASGKDSKPRDQGFTQPLVLFLLPYKRFALEVVESLIHFHCKGKSKRISKKSRHKFEEEYTNSDDLQYGDDFKLGLTLAPRHNMFLYTPFKLSDLILASPLALHALFTEDNTAYSILSSIEIAVIDEAGVMLMQNWEHVEAIYGKMNLTPQREYVTGDIERVREHWLDEKGREYRQNVVISDVLTPEINGIVGKTSNRRGWVKVVPGYGGVLAQGKIHRLRKFECTAESVNDRRFEYFTQEFWPKIKDLLPSPAVIFCSSYYEFVRLKAWFEVEEPGVVFISEYTSKSDRQRNLSYIQNDTSRAVLLTERLMYFRHLKLRAAEALVYYSLPLHPQVYEEMTSCMSGEEVWVVFSSLDALQLQRLFGDEKAQQLVASKGSSFAVNAAS